MAMRIALQLFSVKAEMDLDPLATLKKVAAIGYHSVEGCNYDITQDPGIGFGVPPEILVKSLMDCGVEVIGFHAHGIDRATLRPAIQYSQAIGNRTIVDPCKFFINYDELMQCCEYWNDAGRICVEEGMRYVYHTHHREFCRFGGREILDIILENTDPKYFNIEFDAFWTFRAGKDPVEVIKKHGSRIVLIHQRDFSPRSTAPINLLGILGTHLADGAWDIAHKKLRRHPFFDNDTACTEIGAGIMDIQSIVDAANACSVSEYMILEQEHSTIPDNLASIAASLDGFKKIKGLL